MTDPLTEKIGINVQGGTVNVQNLNIGIAERLGQSGDRVRILVVAVNPLGSSPLKLDHEVKTIQKALRRSPSIMITVSAIAKSVDKICKRSPILLCI